MRTTGPKATPQTAPTKATTTVGDTARVLARQALRYDDGGDPDGDRPAHVRAGSGAAIITIPGVGERLAVVQDDTNVIALVDPQRGGVTAIPLPPGRGGLRQFDVSRGNKADKLDLEAIVSITVNGAPALLAMGSGSTEPRAVFALVTFDDDGRPTATVHSASALFKHLHDPRFAGDELNVEGMSVHGDTLRFYNRGNGAGEAQDATCDVSLSRLLAHLTDPLAHAAPKPTSLRAYDLGNVGGTRLTFTDATALPDGRTLVLAAAEASPNTYDDGEVKGTSIGVIDAKGALTLVPLLDEHGAPLLDKIEGVAVDPRDPSMALVVVDKDDATKACELLRVRLPSSLARSR